MRRVTTGHNLPEESPHGLPALLVTTVSGRRRRTTLGHETFPCRSCGCRFNARTSSPLNHLQCPASLVLLAVLRRLRSIVTSVSFCCSTVSRSFTRPSGLRSSGLRQRSPTACALRVAVVKVAVKRPQRNSLRAFPVVVEWWATQESNLGHQAYQDRGPGHAASLAVTPPLRLKPCRRRESGQSSIV